MKRLTVWTILLVLAVAGPAWSAPQINTEYGDQMPWLGADINAMASTGAAAARIRCSAHTRTTRLRACQARVSPATVTAAITQIAPEAVVTTGVTPYELVVWARADDHKKIKQLIDDGAIGRLTWAVTGAAFGTYHERESRVRGGDDLVRLERVHASHARQPRSPVDLHAA